MKKKRNEYLDGIDFANKTIRKSTLSEVSKLHDEADKKMYKAMFNLSNEKNKLHRPGHSQLYWWNRGKATAFGYFKHNGRLLNK